MNSEEIDLLINSSSHDISLSVQEAARESSNEAEFRRKFENIVETFAEQADIDLEVRDEYILARGRADTVYNRLIIEYEPPGSLRESNNYSNNKHAYGQLKTYIEDIDRRERRKKSRLLGVTTDGTWLIYVKFKEEREQPWEISDPQEINEFSIKKFLKAFSSLVSGAAYIPDNLERDFGTKSLVARKCVEIFYNSLINSKNDKVEVFFKQWQRHFDQATGYSETSPHFNAKGLALIYGMRGREYKLLPLFFAVHSYYASFIKLLALQIVGHYTFSGLPLKELAGLETPKFLEELKNLEEGGIFRNVGINNFLEGDFFSWYLEIWDREIEKAIRGIVDKLEGYDPVTMEVDPELTRDLLKILYQQLVPKELRHDLGEYYTPDWLAERLLNQIQYDGDPEKRVLDPACGSGTFLILALKRIREYAKNKNIENAKLLEKVLKNVAGIDLNPLAVISSRTNFLMAISDLLPFIPKEGINLPIYLADSILTPSRHTDLFTQAYRIKTSVSDFDVPITVVEKNEINNLTEVLENAVKRKESIGNFIDLYKSKVNLEEHEMEESKSLVELLYRKLSDLEERGINHIWARIIKNSFAPLFIGKFDYVIGNPPWINWENLPDEYRQNTAHLWQQYKLFSHTGLRARMGAAKDDISVMMTYVAIDRYLKNRGKLGFIITQSLFKTVGGGEGFRRFQLGENEYFKILSVDDMVDLKPFEGVGNRTSIFICQKGGKTKYPVTYNLWRKKRVGTGISTLLSLKEVAQVATYKQFWAEPVVNSNPTSPWITGRMGTVKAIQKIVGKSSFRAREGVNTGGLNGAYWVKIIKQLSNGNLLIENQGDIGKKHVSSTMAEVESELIFPLLRGENVSAFHSKSEFQIILAQDPDDPSKGYNEQVLKKNYPLGYKYFEKFKVQLLDRSGYRQFLSGQPFYAVYNIGNYTFSRYKVVWKYIATELVAAVISKDGDRIVIPDCKLIIIPFEKEDEAHFVSAMLNSIPARFLIKSFAIGTQLAPYILDILRVPNYDVNNPKHKKLISISKGLHNNIVGQEKLRNDLDLVAAKVWGIEMELKEIIRSYEEIA